MTLPTLTARIAFGTAPLVDTPTWSDLSRDLREFKIIRGRFHELDRMEAGTASILLSNSHGNYWPNNSGGAYYPDVLPVKRTNLRATYSATTYDLFTGFTESYNPEWLTLGGLGPCMRVESTDLVRMLARLLINDGVGYISESSGNRVGNVLDALLWNAVERDLDSGQSTLQATGAIANLNAMDHLFTVQESELGIFFMRGDGVAIFQDRHARLNSPYTTSQATFGDGVGEMPYRAIEFSYDETYLYNDIRITMDGGTEQTAGDATSQSDYGQRSLSRTGLLMTTNAEALSQAQYLLARFKDPEMRVKRIVIQPQRDPTNLWPKVLGYDISTRITIRLDQAGIDADYHIEGITHDVNVVKGTWETTWELSPASAQAFWILGTSLLDTGTRLAY